MELWVHSFPRNDSGVLATALIQNFYIISQMYMLYAIFKSSKKLYKFYIDTITHCYDILSRYEIGGSFII